MTYTFALGIPHAPWLPGRPVSLERLDLQLGGLPRSGEQAWVQPSTCKVFSDCESNAEWSQRMWAWGAQQGTTHFLTLQDDAIVCERFWDKLQDVVHCYPGEVIGLQVAHPATKAAADTGERWATTSDALIGVAYCLPVDLLADFLAWRGSGLRDGAVGAIPEDSLIGLWCAVTGRRVYHPLPALVTHDTSLVSGYAHDEHAHRISPSFRVIMKGPWWSECGFGPDGRPTTPPHLGFMFGSGMQALAREWLIAPDEAAIRSWSADNGAPELRRLAHAARAKRSELPTARIFIATPTRGGVDPEYAASIWRLVKHDALDVTHASELIDVQIWAEDVVRVRSRFVEFFLRNTNATHLLFVDSDVSFAVQTVEGMLRSSKDFVASPYPRRDHIDFARVVENGGNAQLPPEASAYRYSLRLTTPSALALAPDGTCPIDGIGLGMALLSRPMLETMREKYADSLTFFDAMPGGESHVPTTALFQLHLTPEGELLSEDYSFCHRAKESGFQPYIYLGPGSPVTHIGAHTYKGVVESFGFRRVQLPST